MPGPRHLSGNRLETETPITAELFAEDRRLVLRAQGGDRDAFADLVRKYAGVVRALVTARLGRGADADDAVQDVFLTAFRRLDGLSQPDRFAGWISRIAVNRAIEILRRHAARGMAPLEVVDAEPSAPPAADGLERREELDRMQAHLADLDEKTQTILVLRYRKGLAVKEIAEQLGEQPPAVSMRITRGLRRLRARMEGAGS